MKFHADQPEQTSIIAYGNGWLQLPESRIENSVLLSSAGLQRAWHCDHFDALTDQHLRELAEAAKGFQVVLFGAGARNRYPPVQWLAPFAVQQLGIEVMDTAAACRTYNVLVGEGRTVIAGLILEH